MNKKPEKENEIDKSKELKKTLKNEPQEENEENEMKELYEELTFNSEKEDLNEKIEYLEKVIQNLEYFKNNQNRARVLEKQFEKLRIYRDKRDFDFIKKHSHKHKYPICIIEINNSNKYPELKSDTSNIITKCELCIQDYIDFFKKFRKEAFDSSKDINEYRIGITNMRESRITIKIKEDKEVKKPMSESKRKELRKKHDLPR